jgi:hypothetical protein
MNKREAKKLTAGQRIFDKSCGYVGNVKIALMERMSSIRYVKAWEHTKISKLITKVRN